ncbi:MAG: thioredoxin family protein [Bacteroidia bacterium]|nr:thioredoxin family protein [Bacteroidia bacterium]NNF30227.1 thioredoxin family protein [Flavobacteriaceae bacterium]MBT8274512.1 thioredoxin family protein [Bacteroidia bacterium]NNJ83088.1 thioredoxin family protein [Flavobacteriaceae bacterium]NNK54688.1 thioredoxin family protein [Flavobacteriaceae bacterium]
MKNKRILFVLSLVITASLALAGFTAGENEDSYGYSIGDYAAEINLLNVDGNMVSYEDYPKAKGFIVIFTCNTCPYAVASEDRIIALDAEFKGKGYPVIAINPNNPEVQPDDTYELMQAKAKDKGFTFPYLYDKTNTVYAQYGATKTPHVYLLENTKKGRMVQYIGAIDDNVRTASAVKERFLANAVNELLAGKEVSVKETKAIGCSVKQ